MKGTYRLYLMKHCNIVQILIYSLFVAGRAILLKFKLYHLYTFTVQQKLTWIEQNNTSETSEFCFIHFHLSHLCHQFSKYPIKDASNPILLRRIPIAQKNNK